MQLIQSNQITMSSREISELVGSRHDAVRKSAERLAADQILTSPLVGYDFEHRGNVYQEYRFNKRDSLVLVARLSPEFTARIVDRWQELEAQAAEPAFSIPTTLSGALRLAAEQAEQIEHQQAVIEHQRPAVQFVESYVQADGLLGFRQVAKLLGANERKFRQMLLDESVMYYLSGVLTPMAQHIQAGRFEVKTGEAENGHAFAAAKFTPKGVEYVSRLWRSVNV